MKNIADHFDSLLGKYTRLAPRVKHIDFDTTSCGDKIEVRGSYISFRDGEATIEEFVDLVAEHIATFCLPRSEIAAASNASLGNPVDALTAYTRLVLKAQSLFIKAKKGSSRSGEAGEIILFILVEWLLQAPQIVSKMYLKTNNNMPVHGTDGIHARFDAQTQKLFVYWGESKAHKTLEGALAAALSSLTAFIKLGQEKREIEIVSANLDIGPVAEDVKAAVLNYLDPYTDESNSRVHVFACVLIFNFDYLSGKAGKSDNELLLDFENRFKAAAAEFIDQISQKVGKAGLGTKRFEFFLLPAPNVQEIRDKFQKIIGWPDD